MKRREWQTGVDWAGGPASGLHVSVQSLDATIMTLAAVNYEYHRNKFRTVSHARLAFPSTSPTKHFAIGSAFFLHSSRPSCIMKPHKTLKSSAVTSLLPFEETQLGHPATGLTKLNCVEPQRILSLFTARKAGIRSPSPANVASLNANAERRLAIP